MNAKSASESTAVTAVAINLSPISPPTQVPSPHVTSIEPSSLAPSSELSKQINSQQELPMRKDLQSWIKTKIIFIIFR